MLANVLFRLITVLDSSSSKPLAEATVTITRGEETLSEVETNDHGEAALPDLAAGSYRIKVEKAGYVDCSTPAAAAGL
jgi:5-hydroxyisourate hydrolase-like protein (transthyretin family)